MTNLDQFIIHSAYPVEKIVWTAEGVFDSTNPYWFDWLGGYVFEPISDEIEPRDILIDGVWTNDGWQNQYPINVDIIRGYEGGHGQGYSTDNDAIYATIFVEGLRLFSDEYVVPYQCVGIKGSTATGTIQYRLWAYMVESAWNTQAISRTAETLAHSFQKDTRLAQLNMISENILTIPSGQTATIHHNLGFRPYCKMWRRLGSYLDGGTWQKNDMRTVFDMANPYDKNKITIDSNNITIYAEDNYDGGAQDFLIRIFNYAIPS